MMTDCFVWVLMFCLHFFFAHVTSKETRSGMWIKFIHSEITWHHIKIFERSFRETLTASQREAARREKEFENYLLGSPSRLMLRSLLTRQENVNFSRFKGETAVQPSRDFSLSLDFEWITSAKETVRELNKKIEEELVAYKVEKKRKSGKKPRRKKIQKKSKLVKFIKKGKISEKREFFGDFSIRLEYFACWIIY